MTLRLIFRVLHLTKPQYDTNRWENKRHSNTTNATPAEFYILVFSSANTCRQTDKTENDYLRYTSVAGCNKKIR